ncbi:MAG: hypothetical protein JWO86_8540 [Myxococcaceae bacterium]|jgi:hypothetical protein|nr:hypothetical protein [Myxococcaceae bacterium]MEA2746037.1 hypothetical protein [Myxococcales bacterium]
MTCNRTSLPLAITATLFLLTASRDASARQPGDGSPAPTTSAAAPAAPAAPKDDRMLKSHRFLFPVLQDQIPFATTHFGIRQGVALANFPKVPLGPLGPMDLTASGLAQNFDLGVRITDWLAIQGTGAGQVITGVNIASIVLSGASFSASGEAGPLVRILRSERSGTQLAVSVVGGGGTGRQLTVLPLVNALLASSGQSLSTVLNGNIGKQVLVPTSSATFAGTLSAAQTLTPNFGLLASVQGRYTNEVQSPFDTAKNTNTDVSSNNIEIKGALAFTADGSPSGIPVGVMVEYLANQSNTNAGSTTGPSETSSELAHFVSAGLYYTGRANLQVGIAGAAQLGLRPITGADANGAPAKSGAPSTLFGQFILRYVW